MVRGNAASDEADKVRQKTATELLFLQAVLQGAEPQWGQFSHYYVDLKKLLNLLEGVRPVNEVQVQVLQLQVL